MMVVPDLLAIASVLLCVALPWRLPTLWVAVRTMNDPHYAAFFAAGPCGCDAC